MLSFIDVDNDFWSYEGSLTTPPCTEGVKWTVLRQVQPINDEQLEWFARAWANDEDYAEGRGNNRVVQPYFHRQVYRSVPDSHHDDDMHMQTRDHDDMEDDCEWRCRQSPCDHAMQDELLYCMATQCYQPCSLEDTCDVDMKTEKLGVRHISCHDFDKWLMHHRN